MFWFWMELALEGVEAPWWCFSGGVEAVVVVCIVEDTRCGRNAIVKVVRSYEKAEVHLC